MKKRGSILQKKLKELESLLDNVVSVLPHAGLRNPSISRDIQLRFIFLKTLLTAEISSSHQTQPHELACIAHRLTEMEEVFHIWESYSDLRPEPEAQLLESDVINVETLSMCSCTESCLNDDGEAELEENVAEVVAEETGEAVVEKEGAGKDLRRVGKGKRVWDRVLVGGFVIGTVGFMGFVMASFLECFDHINDNCCLTPT